MARAVREKSASQTQLSGADFVHLHNHSHYSLLDGLTKVDKLIERTRESGMEAVALTDHGTLSGAIDFYKAADAADIKPIIGIETYVAARKHTDKEAQTDKNNNHLILLAMNNTGYKNLMKLSTIANLEGYYYKPRIDHDLLEKYSEGIICLSACVGGEVGAAIRNDQIAEAEKIAKWYKKVFGDRYYLELQDHSHQWEVQKKVNDELLKLGKKLDIQCVLTADAHYLTHEDQEAHEVLLCVQTGAFLADEKRMSLKDMDLYFTKPEEIIERWKQTPEVVSNTKVIADRCDVTIELGRILIPKFEVPEGDSEKSFLDKLTYQGMAVRYGGISAKESLTMAPTEIKKQLSNELLKRTEFELDVINRMGFDSYFLIVADFINWGKDQGIVFGPGRGSAAGSIVSYALKITDLDPIKYDLMFERFLNPDRISMPDIDIDIQDSRRDEVIAYCIQKYGQEQVAHIVTFGTMAARNAIRDVARVLQMPYGEADHLAKLVPPPIQGRHIPLSKSVDEDTDLRNAYEGSPEAKRVIDLAIRMEGTIRSHGVHAAGVVIAPDNIVNYTPLEMAQKGVVTTQYSMGPIEELGLLKMDFLGLSNLTIIKNALRIIKRVYKKGIDISKIPLDDSATFELLGRGETTGVFQLESAGMKRYIKQLKPNQFEDIVAMGALYRPGPMQYIDDFIARKNGKRAITYEHESMKAALESTYGILVYQEQVIKIVQELCGFTGAQADTLRKAIGKKKRDVMTKMKKQFIDGAMETSGVTEQTADKLWNDLDSFADYAFNKAHATCYGLISYQTAYLKTHYSEAFMAALMTSDFDDTDRLAIEINECRHMGIEVLGPDVNESFVEFAVVPDTKQIRFGMVAIKNVGRGAVEAILEARANGQFKTIEDFVSRVSTRVVNKKAWESLIKAGAFDKLAERDVLLHNIEMVLAFGSKKQKEVASGQTDLFGDEAKSTIQAPALALEAAPNAISPQQRLIWERELLGLYISDHPLDRFRGYLSKKTTSINNLNKELDGKVRTVGGAISQNREIVTKKGDKMSFITIEDESAEIEIVVFPKLHESLGEVLQVDTVISVKGKVNAKDRDGRINGEVKIIADEILEVSEEMAIKYKDYKPKAEEKSSEPQNDDKRLFIHIKDPDDHDQLVRLKQILSSSPGEMSAVLVLGDEDKRAVKLPFGVDYNEKIAVDIAELFDAQSVKVK